MKSAFVIKLWPGAEISLSSKCVNTGIYTLWLHLSCSHIPDQFICCR